MTGLRFRSVVLDVDSTLCGIEGVDWLANLRGDEIARRVAETTERAMNGEIAMEAVYGERLALVHPGRTETAALADAYRESVAPGARETLAELREAGVRLVLVSGGLRQAILPMALELGFTEADLHAVEVHWSDAGDYVGFDVTSPLATRGGKLNVVRAAGLAEPSLAVGDGATDLAMRPAVTAFAAFTGFVGRAAVVSGADHVCEGFGALRDLVLG